MVKNNFIIPLLNDLVCVDADARVAIRADSVPLEIVFLQWVILSMLFATVNDVQGRPRNSTGVTVNPEILPTPSRPSLGIYFPRK